MVSFTNKSLPIPPTVNVTPPIPTTLSTEKMGPFPRKRITNTTHQHFRTVRKPQCLHQHHQRGNQQEDGV